MAMRGGFGKTEKRSTMVDVPKESSAIGDEQPTMDSKVDDLTEIEQKIRRKKKIIAIDEKALLTLVNDYLVIIALFISLFIICVARAKSNLHLVRYIFAAMFGMVGFVFLSQIYFTGSSYKKNVEKLVQLKIKRQTLQANQKGVNTREWHLRSVGFEFFVLIVVAVIGFSCILLA